MEDQMEAWGLQDPDEVGASEYRAIYECVSDGITDMEPEDNPRDHAIAMLAEFIAHATAMKAQLETK